MDRSKARELQHVGLPTACAVIYSKITGHTPDPRYPAEMQSVLNDVAHALSNLITIYVADGASGVPRALVQFELIGGKFRRGAHAFETKNGEEHDGLTIQRRDMALAIEVLKSAHIGFRPPANA